MAETEFTTDVKNLQNVTLCSPPRGMKPLTERRFDMLFVVGYLGHVTSRPARHSWLCQCACGRFTAITGENLRSENSTNCGCRRTARLTKSATTHGYSHKIPEYAVWKSIRQRCLNPRSLSYADYGGRGITFAEEWNDFAVFIKDVGRRPSPQHTLDRIDNDKGYCPTNCKWATRVEQNNNKRSNHPIAFQGRTQNLQAWIEELHISKHIFHRGLLLNMSAPDALAFAVERKGKHNAVNPFRRTTNQ